jgi:hypothetical protein
MMAHQDIAQQTLLEQGMLNLIMGALQETVQRPFFRSVIPAPPGAHARRRRVRRLHGVDCSIKPTLGKKGCGLAQRT